jgi:serine/threonine-protein kinase HipA
MNAFDIQNYQPSDTLYLWWLGRPERPLFVGELRVARQTKGVSLAYGDAWLRSGFALSEDLPLLKREFFPLDNETAAGAVDDARPHRWGAGEDSPGARGGDQAF